MAKTWAGLAGPAADRSAGPVARTTALRVWVLVYLPTTVAWAGVQMAAEMLMGHDSRDFIWTLPPFVGAAMFIGTLNSRGASRNWAFAVAFAVAMAATVLADYLVRHGRHAPGWVTFTISLGVSTLVCGVFVAATYARPLSRRRQLP